jgi:hypothetical protein
MIRALAVATASVLSFALGYLAGRFPPSGYPS